MPSCTNRENMKSQKELKWEDGKDRVAIPLCQMISRNLVLLLLLCYAILLLLLLDTVSHKVTQNIELVLLLSNNNQPHAIIPLLLPITFRCGGGPNTVQIQI
jgi:hypothetical protein